MTGCGFGGCLVGIVDSDKVENIKSSIEKIYKERQVLMPHFMMFQLVADRHFCSTLI